MATGTNTKRRAAARKGGQARAQRTTPAANNNGAGGGQGLGTRQLNALGRQLATMHQTWFKQTVVPFIAATMSGAGGGTGLQQETRSVGRASSRKSSQGRKAATG